MGKKSELDAPLGAPVPVDYTHYLRLCAACGPEWAWDITSGTIDGGVYTLDLQCPGCQVELTVIKTEAEAEGRLS